MARLIVERSTIMNSLFSKYSCRPESDAVLSALISIFSSYIRRMRKTKEGEDLYSWVRIGSLLGGTGGNLTFSTSKWKMVSD